MNLARPDGSALLVDRLATDHTDARLIAHLAPDEPAGNARLLCDLYLADETRGRCRRLTTEDLELPALAEPTAQPTTHAMAEHHLFDARGHSYRLRLVAHQGQRLELRWTRTSRSQHAARFETVALRDVVAALEDYEPARTITTLMLAAKRGAPRSLISSLEREATRLAHSPIVLNRRLREAVERRVAAGLTLSEIALRCGQVKRNPHGTRAGSATWLARRIGRVPAAGHAEPTRWVHSDTLALIARDGLGMCPNEVEL